jgi:hypothetical protein
MWSEVLYAIAAAVVLYAVVSVVLKVFGKRARGSIDPDVQGESRNGDSGARLPR